jgi:hypothetical protein
MFAAVIGHVNIVELLLGSDGVEINIQNKVI